jgi:hypothetical protein
VDEEFDSENLSWIAQPENKFGETGVEPSGDQKSEPNALERQQSQIHQNQVVEGMNPSMSFGKGRRVVGLKTVVIDY